MVRFINHSVIRLHAEPHGLTAVFYGVLRRQAPSPATYPSAAVAIGSRPIVKPLQRPDELTIGTEMARIELVTATVVDSTASTEVGVDRHECPRAVNERDLAPLTDEGERFLILCIRTEDRRRTATP